MGVKESGGRERTTERGKDMGVKESGRENYRERQGHGGKGEWG